MEVAPTAPTPTMEAGADEGAECTGTRTGAFGLLEGSASALDTTGGLQVKQGMNGID